MANTELIGLSGWIRFDSKNIYTNKNFITLLEFYLFQCPIFYTSIRSNSLREMGWQKHHYSTLSKRLRKVGDKNIKFFKVPVKDLYTTFKSNNQLESANFSDEVVIYHESEGSIDTLFTTIRNAFAHGSYQMKKVNGIRYYCFENRKPGKTLYYERELRARFILKEETLLKWIEIIKSGY